MSAVTQTNQFLDELEIAREQLEQSGWVIENVFSTAFTASKYFGSRLAYLALHSEADSGLSLLVNGSFFHGDSASCEALPLGSYPNAAALLDGLGELVKKTEAATSRWTAAVGESQACRQFFFKSQGKALAENIAKLEAGELPVSEETRAKLLALLTRQQQLERETAEVLEALRAVGTEADARQEAALKSIKALLQP